MPTPKPLKRLTASPHKVVKIPPHARPQPPAFQPIPSVIASASPEANASRVAAAGGRQNLYVAAKDQDTWNRAEKLAEPESLSSLVTGLLRRFVEQREAAKDRIVVEVEDPEGNVVRKAFKGRFLVSEFYGGLNAAQGAGGGIALWREHPGQGVHEFVPYRSWEDIVLNNRDDYWPADFLSAVSSAMGEEYAEEIEL
jgi:hypothetical protein